MLTPRDAERLLRSAVDPAALATFASAFGFSPAISLDGTMRREIGLGPEARQAQLARGVGALRALVVQTDGATVERDGALGIARRIAQRSPEMMWLVIVRYGSSPRLLVAAPSTGARGPLAFLDADLQIPHASDVETIAALTAALDAPDLLAHQRWRETLGRDALSRRFYRELAARVDDLATTARGDADVSTRRTLALLCVSRLLFLAFLQVRGWLDGDPEFLTREFVARLRGRQGTSIQRQFLDPLFFGTLNTRPRDRATNARAFGRIPFLNGGLFARTPLEARHRSLAFTDEAVEALIGGLLSRYRLTPREATEGWSESAVDPEMLGRAFESMMHAGARASRGAFYTPPPLIARLAHDGLVAALEPRGCAPTVTEAALRGEHLDAHSLAALRLALVDVRVLDPACGSGAFLVHALELIAGLVTAAGDARDVADIRRDVLARSIFGVDIDPTAVWLCQLRLWLAVVVESAAADPLKLLPLPNLDRNVREGDALADERFGVLPAERRALDTLRLRYTRATGPRKRTLARALDRAERSRAIAATEGECIRLTTTRRELLIAARSADLFRARRGLSARERVAVEAARAAVRRTRSRLRGLRDGAALPFAFSTHFPDATRNGGFDLIIGNPPWVRPHALSPEQRGDLRSRFRVVRDAAWRAGAEAAAAGQGFAGQTDLAALFVERAVQLAARSGVVAFVVPSKLWISLAGGGVRQLLRDAAPPLMLEDRNGSASGFDAVVYPSLVVARRMASAPAEAPVRVTTHRAGHELTWALSADRLALDETPGAPWLLVPREVRAAFDTLARAGVPLAATQLGRPLLGVKSGCNDAFLLSESSAASRSVPRSHTRPVVRGEDLSAWQLRDRSSATRILWTHDADGVPLATLPEASHRHLVRWRRTLEQRSDARGSRWWSLFRTEAARAERPRVVWGDIGKTPRAVVLEAGDLTVPLNTCYVVRAPTSDDAHALATLLNSPLAAAWLGLLAEPARGGYRRFFGWTCARLPIPKAWDRARALLAPVGRAAQHGDHPDAWSLTEMVLRAYGVKHAAVAPLLSWFAL